MSIEQHGVAAMRRDYQKGELIESQVSADPFNQFQQWFAQASEAYSAANAATAGVAGEVNAMTVATVDAAGKPAARIVLLKAFDARGFVFFTNYQSRKGQELRGNDSAALLLHWNLLERQVRIEGRVEKVAAEESDAYFQSRPISSRIGAWASPQSEVIAGREVLERAEREYQATLGDAPARPPHWGGYRLLPEYFEFWQGRSSRLHDRLEYVPAAVPDSGWVIHRLAP